MPKISRISLKISLVTRLLLFKDVPFICICYYMLCFISSNIQTTYQYVISIGKLHQIIAKYSLFLLDASLNSNHFLSCRQHFLVFGSMLLNYSLQKVDYSAMQPEQCLNISSDCLSVQKSFKKQSQALKIYTTTLLLVLFQARYCSSFNLNTAL